MPGETENPTTDNLITERVRLDQMRRALGEHLADVRYAAGVSQTELAKALDRTSSMISKVEHGEKCLSAPLWEIADTLCGAQGALLSEYRAYAEAERDYQTRWREQNRARHRAQKLARAAAAHQARKARRTAPGGGAVLGLLGDTGQEPAPPAVLIAGAKAQEMMAMFESLVRAFGRRRALQIFSLMTATVALTEIDTDQHTRLAGAVEDPDRVDDEVVHTLWATLTQTHRLYDRLGPRPVLDSFLGQHQLIHHLLPGSTGGQWRRQLRVQDCVLAFEIGICLIHLLGAPEVIRAWFTHARKAAHHGGSPAYAALAAAYSSYAAWLAGDTRAALDAAAEARQLTVRSGDPQVEALVESYAAGAHALAGDQSACLAAVDRAHDLLTDAPAPAPGAPAYWLTHASIDNLLSSHLVLLGRPREA